MKKFTKVCLILIAVCAALGFAFCLIGWCMNGKLDRNPFLHFGHGIQIGWTDETLDDLADFVNHAADGTASQGTDVAKTDEVQSIFGDEEVRPYGTCRNKHFFTLFFEEGILWNRKN